MLEKPKLADQKIIACLRDQYGLAITRLTFLPLGADVHTAVYRAVAQDASAYFVKLRGGIFDETSVLLPKFLSDRGITHIIAPLATGSGLLRAEMDGFKLIVYPFVEGRDGFGADLSERQWGEFGATLHKIHTTLLPRELLERIQPETFSPHWREAVKAFLERSEHDVFDDAVASQLAALLKDKRGQILELVGRAGRLALTLQAQPPEFVLCHSDIHEGNVLIDVNANLYIVDWDNPVLAPKERDLMFIGAGIGGVWNKADQERLFYRGYGQAHIDPAALAYYRYERIVQDIAAFCEQIFSTEAGEDREQALRYLSANFLPGSTLEIAYNLDKTQGDG